MIWTLKNLMESTYSLQKKINGKWVPARPHPGFLAQRIRAAWAVLRGKADAFTWPEGQ